MKILKQCRGDCLEGMGIKNPHWLVADHDITPRVGDLVHCVRDQNFLDQYVKVVLSYDEETGKYTVGSRYADQTEDDVTVFPQRQWISDGVACYPLDGLPYLDEESVCAIFDVDAKKRDKLVVSHKTDLPGGMDFADYHRGDDPLEKLDFQMSLGGDELTLFRDSGGGLVVIKSAYRKPFEAWKECECFKRVDSEGRPYVAVMSGCILRGLISPYKIGENLVETLGAVYNAAGVAAAENQK